MDRLSVEAALAVALRAPSIHNTQPWAWRLDPGGLVVRADRTRQLAVADPDAHSMRVSCGVALHLTETALQAQGWQLDTELLPEPSDPDTLALFRLTGRNQPDERLGVEIDAALQRRSDSRPFTARLVPDETVDPLQGVCCIGRALGLRGD